MATRPWICSLRAALGPAVALITAICFGAVAVAAPPRVAERPYRIVVLPYAPLPGAAVAYGPSVSEALAAQLTASGRAELVPPLSPLQSTAADTAALNAARQRVTKADQLLKRLAFQPAVQDYEAAIAGFERNHGALDLKELVHAQLQLAVARFRLGEDAKGEALLARAVQVQPDLVLEGADYPPVFRRVFQKVSAKLKAQPPGTLIVEGGEGGVAFVDGAPRGRAPVSVEVVPGRHYVTVLPDKGERWSAVVEVPSQAKVAASPLRRMDAAAVSESLADDELDAATLEAAALLGRDADAVVLGAVQAEGERLAAFTFVYDTRRKEARRAESVALPAFSESTPAGLKALRDDVLAVLRTHRGEPQALPVRLSQPGLIRVAAPKDEVPLAPLVASEVVAAPVPAAPPAPAPFLPPPAPPVPTAPVAAPSASHAWVWILVGVGAAAAAGLGTYLYIDHVTRPVTGTGTVRW